ncbi:MAG: CDP-alcohol phosphatidyltransferase family protein [Candidatus Thalassarchaeaceae archaeon]|jgi:phosphatidylserine synthase|nr:CDP-alcohol phosphatidyltransferase family protein [Candidatus Thalassarchaeaceae archaeon]
MKTTFKLMGIADWITLGNGLFGTLSLLFMMLAFDGFASPDGSHLTEVYIWLAMLFILLSALGDVIDGPIARRYSKNRYLGSYLDLMSDSVSFGIAPALLVFGMFSRWGEATPYWTIPLGFACCWVVISAMLRLARFQHESDDAYPWFHGLASPGNALLLVSLSGLVWIQPEAIGPAPFEWQFGIGDHPALDWLLFPGCMLSGMLMISDRRLPKHKGGLGLKLTILMFVSIFSAVCIQIAGHSTGLGADTSFTLFAISFGIIVIHIVTGPKLCEIDWNSTDDQIEGAMTMILDTADSVFGANHESE